ncbi:hypothetical protein [Bradyrhizobium acaciae]|uniref:hypothetical protein n=1 Tax=Bradyrhizobium acaciae TaxID=2683706 RepID=UPI001E52FF4A|nr:hypothetical protein [Bradyrhizobium acaciae]MCC8977926.1 hypothetical protein [Bradyrhizobium acaciae]
MQDRLGRPNGSYGANCSPASTKAARRLFRPFTWDRQDGRRRAIFERTHSRAGWSQTLSIVWPNGITKLHEPLDRAPQDFLPGASHFVSKAVFQQGTRQRQATVSLGEQLGRVHKVRAQERAFVLNLLPRRRALLSFGAPA